MIWVALAQLRTRILRRRPPVVTTVARWVLLAYGLVLVGLVLQSERPPGPVTWILLASLAILSVGLGIARGFATKIWEGESGQLFRRGGAAVVALWAVSLAAHLGIDGVIDQRSPGLGPTTMLAYLVVTVAAQNITVRRRASALLPARAR